MLAVEMTTAIEPANKRPAISRFVVHLDIEVRPFCLQGEFRITEQFGAKLSARVYAREEMDVSVE